MSKSLQYANSSIEFHGVASVLCIAGVILKMSSVKVGDSVFNVEMVVATNTCISSCDCWPTYPRSIPSGEE